MQIDWFTVAAQIVNFLLLVWLLKRFLYRPVLDAMAARQQKIAAALEEARARTQQAEIAAQAGRERLAALDARREEWLAEARQEVAERREEWLSAARREVEAQRADWLAAWRRKQTEDRHALQREAVRRLTEALRHALRELADADLERRMFEPLLARLRALDPGERAALAQAALGGCAVITAFPVDAVLQQDWQSALHPLLGAETPLNFHHDPNAARGITLEMPGHRLAWTLDSYLDGFDEALAQVLNSQTSVAVDDHARS